MNIIKTAGIAAAFVLAGLAQSAYADETLQVFLWDTGADMVEGHKLSDHVSRVDEPLGVTASASTVSAGEISFDVLNASEEMIHEMVVAKLPDGNGALPFNTDEGRVDEDLMNGFGEVAELEPGERGQLTVNLEPGTYVLFCNIPGHYGSGMWTLLTVE